MTTTNATNDTLLDTSSLSTTPPLTAGFSPTPGTPPMQPVDDAVALFTNTDTEDVGDNHVNMQSIHVPDEAALAAAAAAMAAAAQGQGMGLDQQQQRQQDEAAAAAPDASMDGPDDLDSYLLAAAAASVHAQQQRIDHSHDDLAKPQSEDSFDSTATPVPNSVHTNGTSVNGSEEDDARAAIYDQCRKYTEDSAPYPLTIGKRTPGGCAQVLSEGAQNLDHLPFTEATVELGKTRCYWALLSADHSKGNGPTGERLHFVYLDPILQQHMAEQAAPMVGSDFYEYVHPEERDRVSDDMQKIVESRTLFGSVTRCRYSRVPRIRELLGAVNPPRDPEADRYVEDDSFVAIDIVINWIGDGMLLCFFHAIIDKAHEDNDEQHKSDWTNWCGTPGGSFTTRQCDTIWRQVKAVPRETVPESGPVHVFQVIEAGGDGRVLLSWPPPRLFSRDVEAQLVTQSDTTVFQDGSYFADDFARLAQGVSIAPGSSSLSDANTSCTRRFRAKHTLTTEGKVRSIESVLIPYGGVILACFHTTFQQQLPPPDPKLVLQARATLQAQAERRKAEDDVSQVSPNKRPRTGDGTEQADAASNALQNVAEPQRAPAAPQSKAAAATPSPLPPSAPKSQPQPAVATNGVRPAPAVTPAAKPANGPTSKPAVSKHAKPVKSESNTGIAALANPSLMYTNAPAKPPSTPTPVAAARPSAERTPTSNGTANSHAAPSPGAESPSGPNKACTGCGKINSPEWRRGPSGHKTLCNACGLRYARSLTRRKKKKGKDGQVEFIEPTGDPSIVPKSRGGGGGSLPGVHRKNSKKRKEEEAAKAAATATVAAVMANGTPATSSTGSSSSSSGSARQSPAAATPVANKAVSPVAKAAPATTTTKPVKVEQIESVQPLSSAPAPAAASALSSVADEPSSDPAQSIAVSIALDAIAAATSSIPALDAETLPLPVSNAISRAIAATIGSTTSDPSITTASSAHPPPPPPPFDAVLTSEALPSSATRTATDSDASQPLDPNVSAAALQTIESVVSEALYKQLVHSTSLPDDHDDSLTSPSGGEKAESVDLTQALTADAIRLAAQAAVAHGVGEGEALSEP
ncbi:uncharacterized protein UTRI_01453 [Ustilago trichophora]|uniref:GATA-type domain-containing protein n=1 Tax=Ustilago trichophora TaxID=86804 RepID=A0A5C3DWW7_9BASI|nr:uncharacterized protein UTRI_01453 [Ustilago trichophora]